MDYTLSDSYVTDAGTANRMHLQAQAVPTAVSDVDMNMVIWEMMEVLKEGGVAGAPFDKTVPGTYQKLLKSMQAFIQGQSMTYAVDTGAANAAVVSYSPAILALTDGMVLWFKAKAANTGATTLNVNGLGVRPVVGGAHSALQGGEIIANGKCLVIWNATLASWVLIECTGGALQAAPGAQSGQTPNLGQFLGLMSSSGYAKIPVMVAGVLKTFIFQWGQFSQSDNGGSLSFMFTHPVAFPNASLQAFIAAGSYVSGSPTGTTEALTATSTTGFTFGPTNTRLYRIFIIGY